MRFITSRLTSNSNHCLNQTVVYVEVFILQGLHWYLKICMLRLTVHLSICLSVCLFVCLSVGMSPRLSAYLSVCLASSQKSIHPSTYLSPCIYLPPSLRDLLPISSDQFREHLKTSLFVCEETYPGRELL